MPLNPSILIIGKLTVGLMWIVTGATLFLKGDSTLLQAGRLTFWITAAAHVVECAIFFPAMRQSSTRNVPESLALTLVFGVFHYATLKYEELAEQGVPVSRPPNG